MIDKEIVIMYSGGLDTTYITLELAKKFEKVHLLTFCNGVCIRSGVSKKHVSIFQEKFGVNKIEHSIISVAGIFAFLKIDLLKDMIKYRTPLLFDLCCRLSMEMATAIYCIKKGIGCITDGNNPDTQGEMFIQTRKYLEVVGQFFSKYDINYVHPVKMLNSRSEMIGRLRQVDINSGINLFEKIGVTSQLFTEPFCLWAPVAFLFTSRLRNLPFAKIFNISLENAINFRLEKEKLIQPLLNRYIQLNNPIH